MACLTNQEPALSYTSTPLCQSISDTIKEIKEIKITHQY